MTGRESRLVAIGAFGLLLCAACGYHFPGQGGKLPGGGVTIHVADFLNRTEDPSLDSQVRDALEGEVARRGSFKLETSKDSADAVLEGVIEAIELRPIAFSTTDEALQYQTIMTVSASLRDPRTGAILWQIRSLRENDSYGAVPETVVFQSSQFQEQSTLAARDLVALSDVQLTESQKQEAMVRLLDNLSRDIYNAIVEDF